MKRERAHVALEIHHHAFFELYTNLFGTQQPRRSNVTSLSSGGFCRGGAAFAFGSDFVEVFADDFQLDVGELLDLHHFVAGVLERVNDFVEFEVDGAGIAILRVLN